MPFEDTSINDDGLELPDIEALSITKQLLSEIVTRRKQNIKVLKDEITITKEILATDKEHKRALSELASEYDSIQRSWETASSKIKKFHKQMSTGTTESLRLNNAYKLSILEQRSEVENLSSAYQTAARGLRDMQEQLDEARSERDRRIRELARNPKGLESVTISLDIEEIDTKIADLYKKLQPISSQFVSEMTEQLGELDKQIENLMSRRERSRVVASKSGDIGGDSVEIDESVVDAIKDISSGISGGRSDILDRFVVDLSSRLGYESIEDIIAKGSFGGADVGILSEGMSDFAEVLQNSIVGDPTALRSIESIIGYLKDQLPISSPPVSEEDFSSIMGYILSSAITTAMATKGIEDDYDAEEAEMFAQLRGSTEAPAPDFNRAREQLTSMVSTGFDEELEKELAVLEKQKEVVSQRIREEEELKLHSKTILDFKESELETQKELLNIEFQNKVQEEAAEDIRRKGDRELFSVKGLINTSLEKMGANYDMVGKIQGKVSSGAEMLGSKLTTNAATIARTGVIAGGIAALIIAPFAIVYKIFSSAAERLNEIQEGVITIRNAFGALPNQVEEFGRYISETKDDFAVLGMSTSQVSANIAEAQEAFGFIREITRDELDTILQLNARLGISARTSADFLELMGMIGDESQGHSVAMASVVVELAKAGEVAPGEIFEDMANSAEDILRYFRGSDLELVKATVRARQLGVQLSTITDIASSLIDFESSITAEMEASLFIGKNLNLERARQLAWSGDILGLEEEILRILNEVGDVREMNPYAQEALANALKLSVTEMVNIVGLQKSLNKLSAEELEIYNNLGDQYTEMLKAKGEFTGEDVRSIENVQELQTLSEKISNTFGEMFTYLAKAATPAVERILNSVSSISDSIRKALDDERLGSVLQERFDKIADTIIYVMENLFSPAGIEKATNFLNQLVVFTAGVIQTFAGWLKVLYPDSNVDNNIYSSNSSAGMFGGMSFGTGSRSSGGGTTPSGTPSGGSGGSRPRVSGSTGVGNGSFDLFANNLLPVIRQGESGNRMVRYSKTNPSGVAFTAGTGHPRVPEPTPDGKDVSTAAGYYQITETTYDDFKGRAGASELFTVEDQEKVAREILKSVVYQVFKDPEQAFRDNFDAASRAVLQSKALADRWHIFVDPRNEAEQYFNSFRSVNDAIIRPNQKQIIQFNPSDTLVASKNPMFQHILEAINSPKAPTQQSNTQQTATPALINAIDRLVNVLESIDRNGVQANIDGRKISNEIARINR